MPEDVLLVEVEGRVATLTLNRAQARNALNRELRRAILDSAAALDGDDAVDVVIITGADPAFCAGLDLKEIGSGEHDHTSFITSHVTGRGPLPRLTMPVIGAVNGVAITGGLELALNCDFLVASEHARFADTHARVGVQPNWGLTVLLPQAIGLRRAREMSATGNFVDAETALRWGLVNHVVPHDDLLPFCRQLAADIASNDQTGVRAIFGTYNEGTAVTTAEAWEVESRNAARWVTEGGARTTDIAERRAAIQERGRAQNR